MPGVVLVLLLKLVPERFSRRAAALLLALAGAGANAAAVTLVLSDDTAPYQETADALENALAPEHAAYRVRADRLPGNEAMLARSGLLVAVGIDAAEQVAAQGGRTPVLAVLVTEDWYRGQGGARLAAGGRAAGAVLLEQPYSRQFRLLRLAFPTADKVGVVLGSGNAGMLDELKQRARQHNFALVGGIVESETRLVQTLGQVLGEADLLLAVPDSVVLNRHTVQSVLMTSYRYRDPVMGYSKALSRAGALVSLYSTPAQIGRQAGEIAARALAGGRLPGVQWPKYFTVSVNGHVARSLGFEVPAEAVLQNALGGQE